jgi:hypothetical protein
MPKVLQCAKVPKLDFNWVLTVMTGISATAFMLYRMLVVMVLLMAGVAAGAVGVAKMVLA